jgi:regulator of sigma E protease
MILLESILAFIVLIGILVFIHELGHFLAARWTGMRAEVFAVGMGPRLLGFNKVTGFTFGKLPEDLELGDHTDYRISAFPIGGYVKIAGMVDESMDASFASAPPQPWEFRSKNTLQKAFVISAGVIMNFLLAAVVLAGLNFVVGEDVLNAVVGPMHTTSPLFAAGLREGDSVVAVNGKHVTHFAEMEKRIYIDAAYNDVRLEVVRAGAMQEVTIPRTAFEGQEKARIEPRVNVRLSMVEPRRPAGRAGLMAGDIILSADGVDIRSRAQMQEYVSDKKGTPITFTIARQGAIINKTVVPGDDGLIGVGLDVQPQRHIKYGLAASISNGFTGAVTTTGDIFRGIGALVTGKAKLTESVAGPAQIAGAAQKAASEGIDVFLSFLVIISLGLACMNILPIPALDGGHLVFIIVEGITRREVPIKIRMAIQNVGFVLLILLMAFVIVNDGVKMWPN